jgi:hypothetical protein
MAMPKLCTQMPVPDGLRRIAEQVASEENHLNRHRLDQVGGLGGGDLQLAIPAITAW